MPITTDYSLRYFSDIDIPVPRGRDPDVTGIEGGGFVVIRPTFGSTTSAGDIYDVAGRRTGGWTDQGQYSAIDQLANGNLVIASTAGGDVYVTILNSATGQTVVPAKKVFATSDLDVAALADGSFAIASAFRNQIIVSIYPADGSTSTGETIGGGTDPLASPSIAGLDNGNLALAWTERPSADTGSDLWYALLAPNLNEVASDPIATFGEVNEDASVTATSGGFAVTYEADDSNGQVFPALALLDAPGNILRYANARGTSTGGIEPAAATLEKDLVAVTFRSGRTVVTNVLDQAGDVVASWEIAADEPEDPAVAVAGLGRLAVVYDEDDDGEVVGALLQLVRHVTGDGAANVLVGTGLAEVISGLGGDDTLTGGQNDDTLNGGPGQDRLSGNLGDDFLAGGPGIDTLAGGPGNDALNGGPGGDRLDGGGGSDLANYARSGAAVFADLARGIFRGGEAEGDRVVSVENLLGSRFADRLFGDQGPNVISGNAGNDRIDGRAGDDRLGGLAGNDVLTGGPGADLIVGGPGTDFADYGTSAGRVIVNLSTGRGAGNDAAGDRLSTVEAVAGSRFGDRLIGNPADNRLLGGPGNDALIGGPGNDQLAGGPGRDTLNGGAGNDVLAGGPDGDFFRYSKGFGRDTVTGFENDVDNLLLDDALWGGGLRPGQVLSAFGTQKATNTVELDFGGGDVLTVLGPGLTLPQLQDDMLIV